MCDREVLDTQADRDLIVNDAVGCGRCRAEKNDLHFLHLICIGLQSQYTKSERTSIADQYIPASHASTNLPHSFHSKLGDNLPNLPFLPVVAATAEPSTDCQHMFHRASAAKTLTGIPFSS